MEVLHVDNLNLIAPAQQQLIRKLKFVLKVTESVTVKTKS